MASGFIFHWEWDDLQAKKNDVNNKIDICLILFRFNQGKIKRKPKIDPIRIKFIIVPQNYLMPAK